MRQVLPALVLLILAIGLALPLATAFVVMWRAEEIADGRAYCIQVPAGPFDYRAATSLGDLLGYRLRARRDTRGEFSGFHAVLFVENSAAANSQWGHSAFLRHNWSYARMRFVPIVGQGHVALGDRPVCAPAPRYVRSLLVP
ncbi:MAG: hypothetical protein GC150_01570 [Rhizobiales bacterium]|nr:hypothetical protein [Hyphomicrobiales bacterium]